MKKSGPAKGTKYHNEFEQAAGLILLAKNGNDYAKTAEQLGVSTQTIMNWQNNSLAKKEALPVMLETAIRKLLDMMPDKWTGNTWAIAFGIMMDKWLLLNGQPTQRTESLFGDLENLDDMEKDNVLKEAERIIDRAISGRSNNSTPG